MTLTDTGNVCHQIVASLRDNWLKTCSPQTARQPVSFLYQNGRELLEVALWASKQLILSLEALRHSFLEEVPRTNQEKTFLLLDSVIPACTVT